MKKYYSGIIGAVFFIPAYFLTGTALCLAITFIFDSSNPKRFFAIASSQLLSAGIAAYLAVAVCGRLFKSLSPKSVFASFLGFLLIPVLFLRFLPVLMLTFFPEGISWIKDPNLVEAARHPEPFGIWQFLEICLKACLIVLGAFVAKRGLSRRASVRENNI